MTRTLDCKSIEEFEKKLRSDEKGSKTIQKYLRDVRRFVCYAEDREVNKELVLEYKEKLSGIYSKVSANSVIAAINRFLKYIGLSECCVKQYKIQKSIYCSEEKELTKAEYEEMRSSTAVAERALIRFVIIGFSKTPRNTTQAESPRYNSLVIALS